jgi:hypothetical protein
MFMQRTLMRGFQIFLLAQSPREVIKTFLFALSEKCFAIANFYDFLGRKFSVSDRRQDEEKSLENCKLRNHNGFECDSFVHRLLFIRQNYVAKYCAGIVISIEK